MPGDGPPTAGLTSDAGVDLVEDQRGDVIEVGQDTRHASIVRESSPPEAVLASGAGGCPGAANRSSTRSTPLGPGGSTWNQCDLQRGSGHAELVELRLHGVGERAGARLGPR